MNPGSTIVLLFTLVSLAGGCGTTRSENPEKAFAVTDSARHTSNPWNTGKARRGPGRDD